MAGSNHLGNGKLNLGSLREYYRRELLEILDKCSGSKVCSFALLCGIDFMHKRSEVEAFPANLNIIRIILCPEYFHY